MLAKGILSNSHFRRLLLERLNEAGWKAVGKRVGGLGPDERHRCTLKRLWWGMTDCSCFHAKFFLNFALARHIAATHYQSGRLGGWTLGVEDLQRIPSGYAGKEQYEAATSVDLRL